MSICVDEDTVLRYVEGLLEPAAANVLERHLASCGACRALLAQAGEAVMAEGTTQAPTRARQIEPPPGGWRIAAEGRIGETLVNTYELRRLIGRGGMGTVYEAEHRRLARRFAIKLLRESASAAPEAVERLRREAQITSALAHPHIVEVVDFNHTEFGEPFIVMELLGGESLAEAIARGPFVDLAAVAAIAQQTCSALEAAHSQGVVHRDLKPSNIFLCADKGVTPFVKVMDFGISKVLGAPSALTADGSMIGSPSYMSPEQARGDSAEVDARADIFALGVVFFELLCGARPFEGTSVPQVLYKIVHEPPATCARWGELPPRWRELIARALSKEPATRQQSAVIMQEEIARAASTTSTRSGPGRRLRLALAGASNRTAARRAGRSRRWVAFALLATCLALIASWGALEQGQEANEPAPLPEAPVGPTPRRPPAPAATTRAPARVLSVYTEPEGAQVRVDGLAIGRTPLVSQPLAAEARELTLRKPGYAPWVARLDSGDSHARVRVSLTPVARRPAFGRLSVQTKAAADGRYLWATVYLDGKRIGQTPMTVSRLSAGRHRLELERPGYLRESRSVLIRGGRRTTVRVVLRSVAN